MPKVLLLHNRDAPLFSFLPTNANGVRSRLTRSNLFGHPYAQSTHHFLIRPISCIKVCNSPPIPQRPTSQINQPSRFSNLVRRHKREQSSPHKSITKEPTQISS